MHQEQSPPIIQNVIKTMPPPPCPKCPKLNEEIMSLRIALRDNEKLRDTLSSDLESRKVINEDLKRELRKLNDKNNELEESLSDPRIVSAGVYSPKLKTLCEKFRESLYKDIDSADTGSQEMLSNVSTVTNNCSFTVPSTSGFVTNNRNQSQLRAFCMAEDEAEMLSQSSISEMQSDTPNQRLKEINRRNTLCLPHLKSQYPLELNTTPSQHKYFRPPATPSCSKESNHLAKKRKISNASSVRSSFASLMSKPSTSGIKFHHSSTPKVKNFITKMHKTNTSAARLHIRRTSKDSTQK
ncbi:uncharacterized protein [Parasteatoda tepidariorum]|uniref:uncharacterized protein n=1 Tax=Parasteatoda tepidariorum TaxID=114398 RepID=UPI001C7296D8|nr:uncharacterized protein LOC122268317 [Parasteatoda tepidariorum]